MNDDQIPSASRASQRDRPSRAAPGPDAGPAPDAERERRVLLAAAVLAASVVGAGLAIRALGGGLGTALPPFVMAWHPRVSVWVLVTVPAVAAGVAAARMLLRPGVPGWVFAAASTLLTLGLGLAVNALRLGPYDWTRVFDLGPRGSPDAVNQYLPGLPTLRYGVGFYLDRFAEMVPSQPVNVAGHGPFPLLLVRALGITGPGGLAALCIGATAVTPALVHRLGRTLAGSVASGEETPVADAGLARAERTARVAALLCALSPIVLLFGVTTFDAVFMAVGAIAANLLVARSGRWRAVGCLALAFAVGFSWALAGVGLWAVLVLWRRDGPRAALTVAAGCALALGALFGVLAGVWGYDPVGTLRATERLYRESVAQVRPYAFWVLGSPVAWALMLGPAIAAGAIRGALRARPAALALVAVILVAAVAGFTKAETERIWLIFVPLACVAAAPVLVARRGRGGPTVVLALLAAQTLVVELLFDTVW